MIYSSEIERAVLAGLLQHPECYPEVANYLSEEDFYKEDSQLHTSIFRIMKMALDSAERIDATLLLSRMQQLKLAFEDNIDLSQYIVSLDLKKVTPDAFISTVKELKKFTARRVLFLKCRDVANGLKKADPKLTYSQVIEKADQEFNSTLARLETGNDDLIDLFSNMRQLLYDRAENSNDEVGMMGPFPKLNDIYGSILRPGNITVVVARSATGKTTLCLDYCIKVAAKYNVPVIHFDNGEMSEEELNMRAVAAISGVPMYLLESGKWNKTSWNGHTAEELTNIVERAITKAEKIKFFYYNVAGMNIEQQTTALKRFYYSRIGRNNPVIFSYDYIKIDYTANNKDTWVQVGRTVNDFKQLISKHVLDDNRKPVISMFTSLQANRSGVTTNKNSNEIIEDESVASLSDNIIQFCSHMFLLRHKTLDELSTYGKSFGTHNLIALKKRHLGKDVNGALKEVIMPDGRKKHNFINLDFSNFEVKERGDLRDIVAHLTEANELENSDSDEQIPDILDKPKRRFTLD